ncbi:hypothetical protein HOLleu_17031 [Holothuria leucospilota]|uniref:Uncharacterized protein n=1 Tax=Holothuria leucospilota TaxID=206669 RepID=A0A9Q1C501_HOLLE|nr:hypothetical protein HOLleu_17031 [Holothuria leucospilota]
MNSMAFVTVVMVIFAAVHAQTSATESILTFDVNGISRHETRRVEGSIVTLTDVVDGFIVVLDYERDILMLKNLTSQTCFFSRLENIPITKDDEIPIFVHEIMEDSVVVKGDQNELVLQLRQVSQIPFGYILLTNDVTVAGKCSSQPSYWLEANKVSRKRRGDCGCEKVVIGILIGAILFG